MTCDLVERLSRPCSPQALWQGRVDMALVTLVVLASVRVSSGFVRPCRPRGGGLDRWALRGSAASTDALLAFPGKIVSLVSELARYEATREDILRLNAAMDESEGDGGLGLSLIHI